MTQQVGAVITTKFGKIKHMESMLSLANIFEQSEIEDFLDRIKRFLNIDSNTSRATCITTQTFL